MWAVMATVIEAMSESSMQILSNIPILVTASLRSRHKPIVNDAVVMWNRTFGCVETLEYPEDLKRVLLKLRSTVDIDVPGIPNSRVQEVGQESQKGFLQMLTYRSPIYRHFALLNHKIMKQTVTSSSFKQQWSQGYHCLVLALLPREGYPLERLVQVLDPLRAESTRRHQKQDCDMMIPKSNLRP